jgi:hypothetical protein
MRETLYNANGLDETRVKRAFGWIITFRDFPSGSWQTVDGDSMMSQAVTYFTKGRAEFYLDGIRRRDRIPGILSTEHETVGEGGTFELRYTEPTTRVCIPLNAQTTKKKGRHPSLKQIRLEAGEHQLEAGKYLVCLGELHLSDRIVVEESTVALSETRSVKTNGTVLLLQFFN